MTRARDISNVITDANFGGTLDVSGAFTSQGIDDNADATAITIDSSETVGIKNTAPGNYLDGELTVGDSTKDQYVNVVTGTSNAAGICFQDTTGTSIISGLRYTHLDNALGIWTNGSQRATIDSTGNMLFNQSGTGVYLGVTSATASNLLDDYEEGTATLSFSSSGSTFQYSYQIAFYTKVGRNVHLVCYMQLDGGGNSFSGNTVSITGLPFTSINNAGHQATSACRLRFVNLGTGFTYLMATVGSNTTTVGLLQCGDNVAPGTIGANQLSSSSGQVMFSLSYVSA